MKISKVNHVKVGIETYPLNHGGMLYHYPGKKRKTDIKKGRLVWENLNI